MRLLAARFSLLAWAREFNKVPSSNTGNRAKALLIEEGNARHGLRVADLFRLRFWVGKAEQAPEAFDDIDSAASNGTVLMAASQFTSAQRRALDAFGRHTGAVRGQSQGRGAVYTVVHPAVLATHAQALSPSLEPLVAQMQQTGKALEQEAVWLAG